MSDAFYHQGLTIEYDSSDPPHLTIDGQQVDLASRELANLQPQSLKELGEWIIDNYPEYKTRKALREDHLAILKQGVDVWNKWRLAHPETRPILYKADLRNMGVLERPNFSNANLIQSDFRDMKLIGPNFHEANLGGAKLCGATLSNANFCRTDLYETDFSDAKLFEANLQGTQLAKTIFKTAKLKDCKLYGLSAWDLDLEDAEQENHIIRYRGQDSMEAEITVDDLQVAQFIYLLLHNEKIKNVMDEVNSKAVLILGRFTDERKPVLEELRKALRAAKLVPIIFDFERPAGRTFTETVVTLAGLSRFVIVDITRPRSVPLELTATVPVFKIPFVPIIQAGEKPFSMFKDLVDDPAAKGRMLALLPYRSLESLVRELKRAIIEPAQQRADELTRQKSELLPMRDAI